MRIAVLSNLNSRKNQRRGDRAARIASLLGETGIVRATRDTAEIRPALSDFLDEGCDVWVADGGDGTLHWMLNEARTLLEERGTWDEGRGLPTVVPTNGGTIDFVARKARIGGHSDDVIRGLAVRARRGIPLRSIEVGTLEVRGRSAGGEAEEWPFRRLGFAVAAGGVGQRFFKKFYEMRRRDRWSILEVCVKGTAGYVADLAPFRRVPGVPESLREFGRYILGGTRAEVEVDGRRFPTSTYQGLHVGAVDVDFGTMKMFHHARRPGHLHMVVGDITPAEAAVKWPWLVFGREIPGNRWSEFPGQRMHIEGRDGEVLDPVVDGERFFGFEALEIRRGPVLRVPTLSHFGDSLLFSRAR
jgi:hypothetical protein